MAVPAEGCWWDGGQISQTLDAVLQPVAFDTTQVTSKANRSNPKLGDPCHPLAAGAHPPLIVFDSVPIEHVFGALSTSSPQAVAFGIPGNWIGRRPENGGNAVEPMHNLAPCLTGADRHGVCVTGDVTHTLDGANGQAVAVSLRGRDGCATAELGGDVSNCLRASSGGGDKPHVLVPAIALQTDATPKASEELAFTLKLPSVSGGGQPAACMMPQMQVRRLTPVECERLQAFPDNYTLVPVRGKPAADGPRYKALGNSMCVNVMHWIGKRLDAAMRFTGCT